MQHDVDDASPSMLISIKLTTTLFAFSLIHHCNNKHKTILYNQSNYITHITMSDNNQQQQPGLIASHLQYVKGAAEVYLTLALSSLQTPSLTHLTGRHRQRNRQRSMATKRRERQVKRYRRHEGCIPEPRSRYRWLRQGRRGGWKTFWL